MSASINRRQCIARVASAAGGLTVPGRVLANASPPLIQGKAQHVISIWLGGGMGQIDTFDPKLRGRSKEEVGGFVLRFDRHSSSRCAGIRAPKDAGAIDGSCDSSANSASRDDR